MTRVSRADALSGLHASVAIHRPDLWSSLEDLVLLRSGLLLQLSETAYLINKLGSTAQMNEQWLVERVRSFIESEQRLNDRFTDVLVELFWRDEGGEA